MPRTTPWKELRDKLDSGPEAEAAIEAERLDATRELVEYQLAELRTARQVTQVELARALNLPQSNISRIEHDDDWKVSTLRRFVEALGGHLELVAVFSTGDERLPIRIA